MPSKKASRDRYKSESRMTTKQPRNDVDYSTGILDRAYALEAEMIAINAQAYEFSQKPYTKEGEIKLRRALARHALKAKIDAEETAVATIRNRAAFAADSDDIEPEIESLKQLAALWESVYNRHKQFE